MKTKAIFPGSFDPITYGHLDIIKRASKTVDTLIVAILINKEKTALFSIDERLSMLKQLTKDISNVEILSFEGLLVDFAKKQKANFIIRGIRNSSDLAYEFHMEKINKLMSPDLEYIYLSGSEKYENISSSLVKELAFYGADLSNMVPKSVANKVLKKIKH